MKCFWGIILAIIAGQSFGQTGTLEGKVINKVDSSAIHGAIILISGTQLGAVSDSDGFFRIEGIPPGTYDLTLRYIGLGSDTVRSLNVISGSNTVLDLGLPPGDCSDKKPKRCPVDNKTDDIIPIVYGLPGNKLLRKADRGKVWLAGCELTGCDPTWYCRRHQKTF